MIFLFRRRSRKHLGLRGVAIAAVLALAAVPYAVAGPTDAPSGDAADKLAAVPQGKSAPPGEYGSDTYYSSDAEEAALHAIADVAESVDAVGSARTGVDSMLVRVPAGARVPSDMIVGAFTVHFEASRFTVESLYSLRSAVGAAGDRAAATGEKSNFGFGYDAQQDLLVASGTVPPSVTDLAQSRPASGLSIHQTSSTDDGRVSS
ncbi:hypothetical protein [Microlunatus soli]|uniref:Uncharacterized protein n=1 Tax=Microlunatus soli TaxID=630515 RepID=A0A1H1XF19_9ACTN|nr:hypothetical protein [Microlunatus soli]SDT07750.1 hypothetical protein SAMN04489812_4054 [Microlunatus soli]